MTKRIFLALLATLFVANVSADPVEYPTNKDGSVITGVLTAGFDPLGQSGDPLFPFPFNLFYLDLDAGGIPTQDFTLVVPAEDPNDFTDPFVALGAMDGFSTSERWIIQFVDGSVTSNRPSKDVEFGSVVPGQSVRVFQVNASSPLIIDGGIVRELTPGVDYTAVSVSGGVVAIIPMKPLPELSTFLVVLTNDLTDSQGNNATPDTTYYLLKSQTPWTDENGNSTYPLVDDGLARTLEAFRPLVNNWEDVAVSAGIPREDIILSYTINTQSITPVLKNVRSTVKPAATTVGPTGLTTAAVGGAGAADVYAGIITLPYYLGVPSAENPVAPLYDFWTAEPGAYVPPFDMMLSDTESTHITVANPFPVKTGDQTVPLLVSVPNQNSGQMRPAAGWPVVIYLHGITRQRSDMLALADTAAAAGYAMIGIDAPLHGITPEDTDLAPLYIENTPFAPIANERTFDVDYINNSTGAPGPDGVVDPSGTHIINLQSLLTSRDNLRQGIADLSVLAATIPFIDIDGDALNDFDGGNIAFAGSSMGAIMGTGFTAVEEMVKRSFLSVPAGGLMRALEASPTFGPSIQAGLEAAGLEVGSADYELFLTLAQNIVDSGDPLNWGAEASRYNSVVLHEVIGDTVLPNWVPNTLSGTEPLIAAMGLQGYSSTQQDANGVRVAGRFLPPASHGSLLDPSSSPEATVEMQKQFASFIASLGKAVVVENPATMVPISAEGEAELNQPEKAPPAANKLKLKIKK
jgi:hypothetical protein